MTQVEEMKKTLTSLTIVDAEIVPFHVPGEEETGTEDAGEFAGMSHDQLLAMLKSEQEKNARLHAIVDKTKKQRSLTFKVSPKGAVSVYGLGKFPVTLYKETWRTLLAIAEQLLGFIQENEDKLSVKP